MRRGRLDCSLLDVDEPGMVNMSFRVLPVAMNDVGCTTFLCIADDKTHGYGLGYMSTVGFNDELEPFYDVETEIPYDMVLDLVERFDIDTFN